MLRTTYIPSGEPLSEDFSVLLNGKSAQLSQIRVNALPFFHSYSGFLNTGKERPLDETELASLLSFSANEPVKVELTPLRKFDKVTIRPLSEKITPETGNGKITFSLTHPGQYVVELGSHHNALHIFFDPVKDFGVLPGRKDTLYFGPGVHHTGQIVLTDGMTVYIDRDAVVYGSFLAYGSKNIRILGNGILCGSWYNRNPDAILQLYDISREAKECWESPEQRKKLLKSLEGSETGFCNMETYIPGTGSNLFRNRDQFGKLLEKVPTIKAGLHFYACDNVEINGIILKDAVGLTNTIIACEHVVYDNVKTIGWRCNTDGIDIYNSRNCIIRNCFIRSFDDGICMKGKPGYDTVNTENILVENCVVWTDWGRSLEFGVNTPAPEICHIVFRDCDIIHHSLIAMDLGNEDRADIHDVLFEDIRVEYSEHELKETENVNTAVFRSFIRSFGMPCDEQTDVETYMPQHRWITPLACAQVKCGLWSSDKIPGKNHHVVFRNIQVIAEDDMRFPPVLISGMDSEHTSSAFVFDNITFNGKRLMSKNELNLHLGDFVDDSEITLL